MKVKILTGLSVFLLVLLAGMIQVPTSEAVMIPMGRMYVDMDEDFPNNFHCYCQTTNPNCGGGGCEIHPE